MLINIILGVSKMKNKILLSVFVISLILALMGCSGIIAPPLHDKEDTLRIVNNYLLAMSNREFELAKTYCIPDGTAYQMVEEYQNMPYLNSSTLIFTTYLNYIEINGINSEVNINLTLTATVCFGDICSSESETINNYPMYLIKIDDIWKLK